MKKYAIVEVMSDKNQPYWKSYRYDWWARIFGFNTFSYLGLSFTSPEVCKSELINKLKNKGKYTIIQIFEV